MTREEAKGSLIAIKNKYLANYGEDSIINILIDEYDIQAIDVAIQALEQINKITALLDGTIDHFDRDDAIDLLYEIKGVIK